MTSQTKNLLLIRVDKIGDLVLTLNVDQAIPPHEFTTSWVVEENLKWVVDSSMPARNALAVERKFKWRQFFKFIGFLRRLRPEIVVIFYAPTWILFACWIMRVPKRVGRTSRFWSFFLLNRGVRQKRSKSEMHESSYNLALVQEALGYPIIDPGPLKMQPLKSALGTSLPELESLIDSKSKFVVVHPGMAGSALNWPTDHYLQLCKILCENHKVVLTGTESDAQVLSRVQEFLDEEIREGKVLDFSSKLTGYELVQLLAAARAVVAPSTGVVHIAASLGVPTIGLYSPVLEHLARRWGPKGPKVIVFEPGNAQKGMATIKVEEVAKAVARITQA